MITPQPFCSPAVYVAVVEVKAKGDPQECDNVNCRKYDECEHPQNCKSSKTT